MTSSTSRVLQCHPGTPCHLVRGIEARVRSGGTAAFELSFRLDGNLARLRIPRPRPPRRAEHLWRHTCFEAFVRRRDDPAYVELNFSPSSEWAAYAFRGYRDRDPVADEDYGLRIDVRQGADRLELDAIIGGSPLIHDRAPLRLALSAVIEEESGALSYWALRHPSGKPDFHHPDAFALELDFKDSDLEIGRPR